MIAVKSSIIVFTLAVVSPVLAVQGDWIDDPYVIAVLPYFGSGNTCAFVDDIDFSCPSTSPAPDVVYRFRPEVTGRITVDLCGSLYDTQVFILDGGYHLVACNDDYYPSGECGSYVSRLDDVQVQAGDEYFIFVDGYFNACGDYLLTVYWQGDCDLAGHPADEVEGEPGPYFGYVDEYNSGCSQDGSEGVLRDLVGDEQGQLVLSAKSGWCGLDCRDMDWYRTLGNGQPFVIAVETEQPLWLIATVLTGCENEAAWQRQFVGVCGVRSFIVEGVASEQEVWIGLWPVSSNRPAGFSGWQFRYFATFSGLADYVVRTEGATWGEVKALYR